MLLQTKEVTITTTMRFLTIFLTMVIGFSSGGKKLSEGSFTKIVTFVCRNQRHVIMSVLDGNIQEKSVCYK